MCSKRCANVHGHAICNERKPLIVQHVVPAVLHESALRDRTLTHKQPESTTRPSDLDHVRTACVDSQANSMNSDILEV
jgi:hypothetical protein